MVQICKGLVPKRLSIYFCNQGFKILNIAYMKKENGTNLPEEVGLPLLDTRNKHHIFFYDLNHIWFLVHT